MTWVGSAVPVGNELYLYYGGYKRGHKIEPSKERQIGLVKMPMDRFVAREPAEGQTGMLLTVPLRFSNAAGKNLVVNADGSRGQIRVRVRDPQSQVIDGFRFEQCEPISGDGAALPVRWKTAELSSLGERVVQLEFELTGGAKLFGFDLR